MDGVIFIKGEIGVDYTLSNALVDLEKNKTSAVLKIYIDSPGGDYNEGKKIYELFRDSGKIIITENSGMVASMAVNLFLLGSQRFYDASKGQFLIHNPWGEVQGDADFMSEYSKELKKAEKDLINLYVQRTGSLPEVITGLMQIDQPLTSEQVETLGFAKLINNEFKAVAKLNLEQMTEKEVNDKINATSEGIFAKIKAFLKKSGIVKALVLTTADGVNLDFGDALNDPSEVIVGSQATADGAPAEGDYLMPDGVTLVFVAGAVTEIRPKEAGNEELEALKAENASLKEQLTEAKALVVDVKNDLVSFKAQITSDIKGLKNESIHEENDIVRKPFKNK